MPRTLQSLQYRADQMSRNWKAEWDRRVRLGLPTNDDNMQYLGALVDTAVWAVANFDRPAA